MIIKKIIKEIGLLLIFVFIPSLVLGAVKIDSVIEPKTFSELITRIIEYIRTIALVAAPLIFIYAGLKYYFAGGSPEKVKEATDIIKWAVMGLIIILLAEGIAMVIRGVMGVDEEGRLSQALIKVFL